MSHSLFFCLSSLCSAVPGYLVDIGILQKYCRLGSRPIIQRVLIFFAGGISCLQFVKYIVSVKCSKARHNKLRYAYTTHQFLLLSCSMEGRALPLIMGAKTLIKMLFQPWLNTGCHCRYRIWSCSWLCCFVNNNYLCNITS